ncbi:MAG: hypothetical protein NUV78_00125 [Candidatus Zambryskibacteria bacterium]|nr:hypothetical protein [Candidatus Zambryskibacteria bacterium]
MLKHARFFVAVVAFALVTAACSDSQGVITTVPLTTTSTTTTTTTTTTVPPTTTSTTITTTTTMPITTTTEAIPPMSGFYIVGQEEYPKGIPFSVGDFGNVPGSQLGGVGYYLPEGSEVYAPFDGYLDTQASSYIAGHGVRTGLFFQVEDMSGDTLLNVLGNSLRFVEDGPKEKGEVIAVVTDPGEVLMGLGGPVNVLVNLSLFDELTGGYKSDEGLTREFFSYLP